MAEAAVVSAREARVVLTEPLGLLHYRVPPALADALDTGVAVRVPLGKRTVSGYVVEADARPAPSEVTLRDISGLDEDRPRLPGTLLRLVLFAADYYGVPAGEVLAAALPPLARSATERLVLTDAGKDARETSGADGVVLALGAAHPKGFTVAAAEKALGVSRRTAAARLAKLVTQGLLARARHVRKKRPSQEARAGADAAVERALTPTVEQEAAVAAINARLGGFAPFLLHGVTGSGKTEVYLQVIERALEQGMSALVLVPEIALTPQLGARFRARFGDAIATFHSGLTQAQRRDEWERVLLGEARIGLGARSALFLPLQALGVIIVDEEHETTFKQEEAPRYNARDLALVRGKHEGAVVVLGSATPSLESRHNADGGRYAHLSLGRRVYDRPLPEVKLIELGKELQGDEGILTAPLLRALDETLAKGEQSILFINRRGFAPYVFCKDCGHAYRCGECDVSLTFHKRRGVLACHYCGHEEPAPDRCAGCDGHRVGAFGLGIERIEEDLRGLFGDVGISRLDRDTVRSRKELELQLGRFASGEAKILLGTQMVTKGHDYPGVTLVGVVLADASLNFPDFRAAERTFQILTQVAGRAGRGAREGKVLVQTFSPAHYAIAAAARHDYETFAAQELAARRELGYPPFSHLALVRCEGEDEAQTTRRADELGELLRERARGAGAVSVLGPAPAVIARLRGLWRMHILLKSKSRPALRAVLGPPLGRPPAGIRQILDVDPYGML